MNKCVIGLKMKRGLIGIIIVILILFVVIIAIWFLNSDSQRLKRNLSLGNKYLTELNYASAILAYKEAITINPKSEEAYLGLANAYIGKEEYDTALLTVEHGIEIIGETKDLLALSKVIKEKIEEIKKREAKKIEEMETIESIQEDTQKYEIITCDFTISKDYFSYYIFDKDILTCDYDELDNHLRSIATEAHPIRVGDPEPEIFSNESYIDGYRLSIIQYTSTNEGNDQIVLYDKNNWSALSKGNSMEFREEEHDGDQLLDVIPSYSFMGRNINDVLSDWNAELPSLKSKKLCRIDGKNASIIFWSADNDVCSVFMKNYYRFDLYYDDSGTIYKVIVNMNDNIDSFIGEAYN